MGLLPSVRHWAVHALHIIFIGLCRPAIKFRFFFNSQLKIFSEARMGTKGQCRKSNGGRTESSDHQDRNHSRRWLNKGFLSKSSIQDWILVCNTALSLYQQDPVTASEKMTRDVQEHNSNAQTAECKRKGKIIPWL